MTAGPAVAVVLSVDAPSPRTGTGNALVLDGHDAALVRATIVDAAGNTVGGADDKVTFLVRSGPARVTGVHNGDATSAEPQAATARKAYHGMCRAVVKVTVDSLTPSRGVLAGGDEGGVDVERGDGVDTVQVRAATDADSAIVVSASAPGLKSGTITIAVSSDFATHGPLAVATAAVRANVELEAM